MSKQLSLIYNQKNLLGQKTQGDDSRFTRLLKNGMKSRRASVCVVMRGTVKFLGRKSQRRIITLLRGHLSRTSGQNLYYRTPYPLVRLLSKLPSPKSLNLPLGVRLFNYGMKISGYLLNLNSSKIAWTRPKPTEPTQTRPKMDLAHPNPAKNGLNPHKTGQK